MKKIFFPLSVTVVILAGCSGSSKQGGLHYFNDFEGLKGWVSNSYTLKEDKAHSGKFVSKIDEVYQYSEGVKLKLSEISSKPVKKVRISAWCKISDMMATGKFVVSVNTPEKAGVFWEAIHLEDNIDEVGTWTKISGEFNIAAWGNKPDNTVVVYVWNTGKIPILVDDMDIEFVE